MLDSIEGVPTFEQGHVHPHVHSVAISKARPGGLSGWGRELLPTPRTELESHPFPQFTRSLSSTYTEPGPAVFSQGAVFYAWGVWSTSAHPRGLQAWTIRNQGLDLSQKVPAPVQEDSPPHLISFAFGRLRASQGRFCERSNTCMKKKNKCWLALLLQN